jgi:hypothetical protein
MEFLKVEFPDDCGVVINGATGTWRTKQTLQFQAGHYIVSLSLPPGTFDPRKSRSFLPARTFFLR